LRSIILKTLVGEEAFQQSLSALSAKPEKSSAFGVPKQWANTVQQTADRLNALPASGTASASKKKGGRPTKAEAEARLAAMTPEERLQAEAKKAEAKAKRAAKKAEDSASVASATEAVTEAASAIASGSASGETSETGSKKKAGRPKMTEEQKAEAKAKREAKKAAKAAEPAEPSALEGEWAEMAEALESN
jgi:colicin import membrane protein